MVVFILVMVAIVITRRLNIVVHVVIVMVVPQDSRVDVVPDTVVTHNGLMWQTSVVVPGWGSGVVSRCHREVSGQAQTLCRYRFQSGGQIFSGRMVKSLPCRD